MSWCAWGGELIRAADAAMYAAKRGRHDVVVADQL
jgi:PleD family two-component response regulator